MEVDFDKEIDTLLRKAQRDGPIYVGDFASAGHLDADQISAFAENAMPEKSRALYSAHLADCDRCRKILSNVLIMNADAIPASESPSAITIAERSVEPWYKRLFLFPNLAYVMGGLVLVFSGFLGYTVMQRSGMGGDAIVSQVSESESTQGGPNFQSEPAFETGAANMANMSSNTAENTAVVLPNAATANSNASTSSEQAKGPAIGGSPAGENSFVLDGASTADTVGPVAAAPPSAAAESKPAPKDARERDDEAKAKVEEQAAGANIQELAKNDAMLKQRQYQNMPTQSGPMRNNESQYNRKLENLERREADKKKSAARAAEGSSGRRTVGGRTFDRKQGVWYDSTYQGRPTIMFDAGPKSSTG